MILEAAKGFEMDTNWFHNVLARSSELFVKWPKLVHEKLSLDAKYLYTYTNTKKNGIQ